MIRRVPSTQARPVQSSAAAAAAVSATADSALEILKEHGKAVESYLTSLRSRYTAGPSRLLDSIEYSLMAGGKRLRPALVLETARACGASPDNRSALAAAGAIELIHTFSLVHDDLPAMDDDDLRRGRPTNHKVFGEAMAILAGDAMVTMAFEVIAVDAEPSVVASIVRELASASGPVGMIGGQVLDIDGENVSLSLDQLRHLHAMKTGALLTCSCRMGAIAAGAGADKLEAVTAYGRHLGLAFQIVDDLLDVTSTPEQMGKATGKDAGKGKNTYPSLMGLEASRREAAEQLAAGLKAIESLGAGGAGLKALARFVVERQS
jgi:geranylgeranyl pyrophosphate synthase